MLAQAEKFWEGLEPVHTCGVCFFLFYFPRGCTIISKHRLKSQDITIIIITYCTARVAHSIFRAGWVFLAY